MPPAVVNIERLRLITGDDPGLLRELIPLFLDDTAGRVERLIAALRGENWRTLAAEAHAIKGASANMGAEVLQQACAELEKLARDLQGDSSQGSLEQAEQLVQRVVRDHEEASRFFRAHAAKLASEA